MTEPALNAQIYEYLLSRPNGASRGQISRWVRADASEVGHALAGMREAGDLTMSGKYRGALWHIVAQV